MGMDTNKINTNKVEGNQIIITSKGAPITKTNRCNRMLMILGMYVDRQAGRR